MFPDDERAKRGLEACDYVPEWEKSPNRYIVAPIKELNSRYSDYGPAYVGGRDNEVIFTSMREGVITSYSIPYTKLYEHAYSGLKK